MAVLMPAGCEGATCSTLCRMPDKRGAAISRMFDAKENDEAAGVDDS